MASERYPSWRRRHCKHYYCYYYYQHYHYYYQHYWRRRLPTLHHLTLASDEGDETEQELRERCAVQAAAGDAELC